MKVFKATDQQILQIAANAVNASPVVGMGILRATGREVTPADFLNPDDCGGNVLSHGLSIDYFQGRMTKLRLSRAPGKNMWIVPDHEPRGDYQGWCIKYPTYEALIRSVPGVEIETVSTTAGTASATKE